MPRTLRPPLLAALLLSALPSGGCRTTRTITERVEVPVRVPVTVEIDRCPVRAPALPPTPVQDVGNCVKAYGDVAGLDAICFGPADAHRLAALLDVLIDVYADVSACPPPAAPATPTTEGEVP